MEGAISKRAGLFHLSPFFLVSSIRFTSIDKRKVVGNGRFRGLLRYCVTRYFMVLEYYTGTCKGRQQQTIASAA